MIRNAQNLRGYYKESPFFSKLFFLPRKRVFRVYGGVIQWTERMIDSPKAWYTGITYYTLKKTAGKDEYAKFRVPQGFVITKLPDRATFRARGILFQVTAAFHNSRASQQAAANGINIEIPFQF